VNVAFHKINVNIYELERVSASQLQRRQLSPSPTTEYDQYWDAAAWHYKRRGIRNCLKCKKKAKAHGLELLEVPGTAGQVGLLKTLCEILRLHLAIRRKRAVLLRSRLVLLLYRCRLRAATKEHRGDAMANC